MTAGRTKVFVSYSHEDKEWLDRFVEMLSPAVHEEMLDLWADQRIAAGDDWLASITQALEQAQIALVLVSSRFLASEFVMNEELPAILDSAQRRGLTLFWVPISASMVQHTKLGTRQAVWDPEKPLELLSEAERTRAIWKICQDLCEKLGQASRVTDSELEKLHEQVQASAPPGLTVGEFVASGPSSVVFRGEREGLPVAIKVFVDTPLRDRPSQEVARHAELAKALKHPVFIKVYGVKLDARPRSVITEYVEEASTSGDRRPARTLAQVLQADAAPFGVDRTMIVLRKLAEALSEAHERGLVYGLMKSGSVLMQDALSPRLSAFGFWTFVAKDADSVGNFVVNRELLSYMTPEQFYGQPVTQKSDQYALGLLALEMLEGARPVTVRCAADFSLKRDFFHDAFKVPRAWEKRHAALAEIVRRMLSRYPEDRWASLGEVTLRLARLECEGVVLAKNSYRELCEGKSDFWADFYARMFALAPDIQALFGDRDMHVQYGVIDRAVQALLNFPSIAVVEPTVLSATAQRHRSLPIEQRHYDVFGKALLETLAKRGATPAIVSAWQTTIACGLEYMKTRASLPSVAPSREIRPDSRLRTGRSVPPPSLPATASGRSGVAPTATS